MNFGPTPGATATLALTICVSSAGTAIQTPPPAGDTMVTLERTACLGSCPVYTVSIEAENADGEELTPTIRVRETIMGVDFSGDTPVVITPSGTRELDTIRSVLDVS